MAFGTFADMCNHHHSQFSIIFITSKRNPVPFRYHRPPPIFLSLTSPKKLVIYFVSMDLPIPEFHMNGII